MSAPVVIVKDLSKRFGSFTAVDSISFTIPQGEIFALLGPNGAGKTTTIRMLTGLMLPDAGHIEVLGFDVRKHPDRVKERIGYMSQKFSLYNDLNPRENLQFYGAIYGLRDKAELNRRTEELLEMSGLTEYAKAPVKTLSGAMRQRMALACAIIHRPQMLFLDEATAGVDPVSRRDFWELIYRLAGEGISVLATTHYMEEADYCNIVAMMYQGRLVKLAEPDQIKDELPGVLLQVDCDQPVLAQEVLSRLDVVTNQTVFGVQLHTTVRHAEDEAAVRAALEAAGITINSIEIISPSLEDAFTAMVMAERQG